MLSDALVRLVAGAAGFGLICFVWAWLPNRGRRPRDASVWHTKAVRGVVPAAGAIAATVVSGPALVGDVTFDALWRGIFALGLGFAGMVAPMPAFLAAFGILAVGLRSGTVGAGAAVGVGLLVGVTACRIRVPRMAGSAAALLLGLLATRPDANGGAVTLLIPTVAVAVIAVAVLAGVRGRTRVWTWFTVSGAVLLFGGVAFLGGVGMLRARPQFEAGTAAAKAAITDARAGNVASAQGELAAAQLRLADGRRRLGVWWARPARVLPIAGINIRAVDAAASVGITLGSAASDVVSEAKLKQLRMSGGRIPVEAIRALDPSLVRTVTAFQDAQMTVGRMPSRWLVGPVRSRVATFGQKISEGGRSAHMALDAERLAVAMLGGSGVPRTYFLALTTPGELRGSTGFIGDFGELHVGEGSIKMTRFGPVRELVARAPSTPDGLGWDAEFLALYRSQMIPNALWQNLTMSPDFPTVADAIERLYPQSGGRDVDGVIAVDPIGLAALLAVEGPVTIPTWPDPIGRDNVIAVLEHDQYQRFPDRQERDKFLEQLSVASIAKLRTAAPSDLVAILRTIGPAVAGKHLTVASSNPDEETVIRRLGISGGLQPVIDDALSVLSTNAGPNKIDYYLRRSIDYEAFLGPDGRIDATLTVRLTNGSPSSGEVAELIGSVTPSLPVGSNRLILWVLTPWTWHDASLDGRPAVLADSVQMGRHVLSIGIDIPPGARQVVTIRLTGQRRAGQSYRLDVGEQPMTFPDQLTVSVHPRTTLAQTLTRSLTSDTSFMVK